MVKLKALSEAIIRGDQAIAVAGGFYAAKNLTGFTILPKNAERLLS